MSALIEAVRISVRRAMSAYGITVEALDRVPYSPEVQRDIFWPICKAVYRLLRAHYLDGEPEAIGWYREQIVDHITREFRKRKSV